jgi:hypothetical protein
LEYYTGKIRLIEAISKGLSSTEKRGKSEKWSSLHAEAVLYGTPKQNWFNPCEISLNIAE